MIKCLGVTCSGSAGLLSVVAEAALEQDGPLSKFVEAWKRLAITGGAA